LLDIKQIRKDPSGYPRSFFVKGVLSNALTILFWLSIIFQPQKDMSFNVWQMKNIAFSFNVIVGNILFWIYWGIYEVNRKRLE